MGFSFHDQNSMAEVSTGGLRFAPPNGHNRSLEESKTESIVIGYQETGDDDLRLVGTQLRDNWDIEMVDRGDEPMQIEKYW